MDCQLEAVFEALAGGPPADVRMRAPPFLPRAAPPPADGSKPTYGGDLPYHVDTANFAVQWSDPGVSASRAQDLADQLEAGWTALVEEQGWPVPPSADRYRLWVILDPELGGSGFTTEYTTDAYPDGYPVMFVNPDYEADTPAFGRSVAVHEFGHAIQYGLRDWAVGGEETWYWEASAEWMAELGAPDLDTYALSTYWYALHPELAWNSGDGAHPYGMVLLPAWLDESLGDGAFPDTWLENRGEAWAEVLPRVAGAPLDTVIRGMTGAYAAHRLRESALYFDPAYEDVTGEASADAEGELGTFYLRVEPGEGERFFVEGDVTVAYAVEGEALDGAPAGPFLAAVTTLSADTTFRYGLEAIPVVETPDAGGCGCRTGNGAPAWSLAALLLTTLRRGRAAPR